MNGLVGYGSSDDEDDIQPEKPAKIAKLDTEERSSVPEVIHATSKDTEPQDASRAEPKQREHPTSLGASAPALEDLASEPLAEPLPEPEDDLPQSPTIAQLSPYTAERARVRELTMPKTMNLDIPDSPPPPAMNSEKAASLTARTRKFERFLGMKKQGVHFNQRLQDSASLRNPSLLPKLMEFAEITQKESYASTLPEGLAVPTEWPSECYVEKLVRENDGREKKRLKERDRIDFVGGAKEGGVHGSGRGGGGGSGAPPPKKRSRFDQ